MNGTLMTLMEQMNADNSTSESLQTSADLPYQRDLRSVPHALIA